jgi:sulfur carrier protein
MPLAVIINGQARTFEGLTSPVPLAEMIERMELKADRVAVEHNGKIAQRANWPEVQVNSGDRLEIVHFVGGGCSNDPLVGSEPSDWGVSSRKDPRGPMRSASDVTAQADASAQANPGN